MNDPYLAGARALRHARDTGEITQEAYAEMYAAIARAAEQDSVACSEPGCDKAAYIGTRCAQHTTRSDVLARVWRQS